jgi:hypothetical protein
MHVTLNLFIIFKVLTIITLISQFYATRNFFNTLYECDKYRYLIRNIH